MSVEPQDWLINLESGSTIIRNFGLVIATIIALWFARRRILVADRQVATAQHSLLNERHQKGAEMLGSEVLAVRLGGIYALAGLAREESENYHTKIMRLLCSFVRNPAGKPVEAPLPTNYLTAQAEFSAGWDGAGDEEGVDRPLRVREDIQAVMTAIGERSNEQIKAEEGEKYRLDLKEADLKNVYLEDANLERANLYRANLEGAVIIGSNLDRAYLYDANLEGASLLGSTLRGSKNLTEAVLSDADLIKCKNLTQEQLDRAVAHKGRPPDLTGAVDANTGEPLVWRGGTPRG